MLHVSLFPFLSLSFILHLAYSVEKNRNENTVIISEWVKGTRTKVVHQSKEMDAKISMRRKNIMKHGLKAKCPTVLEAGRNEAWEMFGVVKNKGEKIRGNGGGTSEGERGSKERVKDAAEDILPWSSQGSACACEKDCKPCRGRRDVRGGGAVKWGLEAELSTDWGRGGGGREERLHHRDRELECVRAFTFTVGFSGEWMMRGLQLRFLLHWRIFNWILLKLNQCFNTGLLPCHQLLYDP